MRSIIFRGLLATCLLAPMGPASAEDIDLFVQPSAGSAGLPNVLLMIDNTGNWSPMFNNEVAALVDIFEGLATNADGSAKYRVGVMFATETGGGNPNIKNGGYVRAAMRPMDETNSDLYAAMIAALDVNKDKGDSGASGLAMAEAYRYFSGGVPYAGNGKAKTDYLGNVGADWSASATDPESLAAMQDVYALPDNALTSKLATRYTSPIPTGYCGKNYIIYISNGANQESADDDATSTAMLAAAGGNTRPLPISPSGSASNPSDEWARFMKQDLDIVTYTVDIDPVTTGQGPGWTALLESMAEVSDGNYYAVDSSAGGANIKIALGDIFSRIQSVNSVFASVSLPVSVNTEGTYLNQVYIGMFRPDLNADPRWAGNLKQYKLARVGPVLKTVDAYEYPQTINPVTGFIDRCARSYWTPTTMDSYWQFRPAGDCTTIPAIGTTPAEPLTNAANSNRPDGNIVEKGAQAYVLRSSTTRAVKTCSSTFSSCTSAQPLVDFDNTNVSTTDLGAADDTARDTLINWAKGLDTQNEDIDLVTTGEMRPSAHGDVVHSRPVAINYGTDASPRVVVFYGGNDGVLRAINGNRSTTIDGIAPGREYWSFIPPEFYQSIKRLYNNTPQINFKTLPAPASPAPTPIPKPYGIDGPMTVFKDSTRTWIYAGMRRGGRAVYAFDVTGIVTDPAVTGDTPVTPSLLWKRGCPNLTNDTGCSSGWEDIGQTWSAPKVMQSCGYVDGSGSACTSPATPVKAAAATPTASAVVATILKPMLIMGGGYDDCEDTDPHSCDESSDKGNRIYVIDAADGTRLKSFPTERPVVGDITVVPDSVTGVAQWAYAADMGGNVYRISGDSPNTPFDSTTPSNWNITKIATLGCATKIECSANRKFMFAPDVVTQNSSYVLLLGSGDREKPLKDWTSAYATNNYFFMFKDTPADTSWLSSENGNCGDNLMCLNSLVPILTSADPTATDLASKKGWYLKLNDHEQIVTSAITVFGTVTFSSHTPVPAISGCVSNLGTARVYNVSYKNASTQNGTLNRSEIISGGGLPPSPVAGMVTLDDNTTVPFLIGGDSDSPLQSLLPTGPVVGTQPKAVTYWYIHK